MKRIHLFSFILAMLFVATVPGIARAEETAVPMDSSALAKASGGAEAEVNSTIVGNSIGNVGYTGGVSNVSAYNNSGLTTLIENTGNQVSISTATTVNINLH
jgi:hypothetical protein